MKRRIIFFIFVSFQVLAYPEEYQDPATNVVYSYDPMGDRAEVKQGKESPDVDSRLFYPKSIDAYGDGMKYPGSPNAVPEITILNKFTVDGKEYIVDKIGDYAFSNMQSIVSIHIPSSVKKIGQMAFFGCSSLSNIVIEEGVVSIEDLAFAVCESLAAITLPETLERIGFEAFSSCSGLTSIYIPASVTNIESFPFYNCQELSTISVASSNPVYDSRNDCNAIIESENNMLIVGCKNTIIPTTCTAIGDMAFALCKGLESITIPESVEEIGKFVFEDCTGLKQIFLSEGLKSIHEGAFSNAGLSSITIPSTVRSIESAAFYSSQIKTITSLIESPFEVQYICLQKNKVTLRVPVGTKAIYEATAGWNDFYTIEEFSPSEIKATRVQDDSFSFLFDFQGRRILGEPKHGVYIQNGKKAMR